MTNTPDSPSPALGHVTLVGAGPGDPELLTVKAARALAQATLVLYDHLVSNAVMDLLPADCERIHVGKRKGLHTLPQAEITAEMIRFARAGRSLVRLKGGDPYVFGRGGEEVAGLSEAGVPFTVIPGITAAQAASCLAGIPLTHRDHAQSVVLATGHLQGLHGDRHVDLDWPSLVHQKQTLVIYMGLGALPIISEQLVAHGMPADTPAALIERASLPEQRVVTGTVARLPALAVAHQVESPALIMIGGVVSLHPLLAPHH
ncbi:uroporphyrinogen-III C-methyltransferase [Comamonas serinivorans]|uniref:uroporphyrinogen-III C-methyltransferase n=1 Tax=Comamonas serinivorans TaxID=1082851 RepID=A0A1Y0EL15_9BURK|nr:uroporphyrinogen-III C-methyltransferase [Comamonas serinivorans]ARU04325.1 uroporphyrinogen-III C-methyltransferase [Comamonas serinivorans]